MVHTFAHRSYYQLRTLLIIIGTLLLLCLSLSTPAAAMRTISIGFSGPITGLSRIAGTDMRNAAVMAIDDLNQAGLSLHGDKLHFELLVQDDKSNPRIAGFAAQYFVSRKVAGVVGIYNSAVALSSSAIYQSGGIAHFAVSASRSFTRQGNNTAFRLAAYDDQRADALVGFAIHELNKRKVAIIYPDDLFGISYKDSFIAAFKRAGVNIISVESVSVTTFDFNQEINHIKAMQPDVIFFAGLADQTAMLAKSLRRLGVNLPLVTAASVADSFYLSVAGEGAEGTVSIMPGWRQQKSQTLLNFEEAYRLRYGTHVGAYAASAYDQVQLIAAAILQAGSTDPHDVTKALHTINYKGLIGNISFDANGDLRELSFSMYQVQNHIWIALKQFRIGGTAVPEITVRQR
ncbi:branched-chain amino acid transport system substrate-binding protein [Herbaspirillum sp. Sphag1AN]|uniref:branched-chain amino acid ABC transporter substrate-binding protein n=1 Tax=unclassified Herbaspirillum TaxID=2624150 RepID=UPI001610A59B|nr:MULTISPECIES: branched-chain amino acid ABC transporter substrate-binding protein [unclassified Herbaspirillum]MBB3213548.1 branched-chain amino acid transport system substrate-binding protein [Herbaspirillum sp. Sphag1AN]MBB3246746.1 branched-chain amino acid transport system substrate-binding protein [Herbaspirillum sp. Sphag64]